MEPVPGSRLVTLFVQRHRRSQNKGRISGLCGFRAGRVLSERVDLQALLLHHALPAFKVFLQELPQLCGRARCRLQRVLGQPLLHVGCLNHGVDLALQPLDQCAGVGIAGGSFSVGVAYVVKWYPKEKQGTALGIFGAGNVGAAVTKFAAPFLMLALGWEAVAQVWAGALLLIALASFFLTRDEPQLIERRRTGQKPVAAWMQLEPLKDLRVWRFALYYFFVFGGFVALALWLPHYLTGAYGVGIGVAGMLAAAYSIPGSLFRVFGGWLSDRVGARKVMYLTFIISVICAFIQCARCGSRGSSAKGLTGSMGRSSMGRSDSSSARYFSGT